jgi:hypothetical protein
MGIYAMLGKAGKQKEYTYLVNTIIRICNNWYVYHRVRN